MEGRAAAEGDAYAAEQISTIRATGPGLTAIGDDDRTFARGSDAGLAAAEPSETG